MSLCCQQSVGHIVGVWFWFHGFLFFFWFESSFVGAINRINLVKLNVIWLEVNYEWTSNMKSNSQISLLLYNSVILLFTGLAAIINFISVSLMRWSCWSCDRPAQHVYWSQEEWVIINILTLFWIINLILTLCLELKKFNDLLEAILIVFHFHGNTQFDNNWNVSMFRPKTSCWSIKLKAF